MGYDIKQEWWDDVGRGAKGGPKQGSNKTAAACRAGHKICSKCGQEKPEGDFYTKGGRPKQPCKECSTDYRKQRYITLKDVREKTPEQLREMCRAGHA